MTTTYSVTIFAAPINPGPDVLEKPNLLGRKRAHYKCRVVHHNASASSNEDLGHVVQTSMILEFVAVDKVSDGYTSRMGLKVFGLC